MAIFSTFFLIFISYTTKKHKAGRLFDSMAVNNNTGVVEDEKIVAVSDVGGSACRFVYIDAARSCCCA